MKEMILLALLVVLLFLGVISCTPSTPAIKTAITQCVENGIPMTWSGSLLGGKNTKVSAVDIIAKGKYNKLGNYWPVKARVIGTTYAILFMETKTNSFDKATEFLISKDDYGQFIASFRDEL